MFIALFIIPLIFGTAPFLIRLNEKNKRLKLTFLLLTLGNILLYFSPLIIAYLYSLNSELSMYHGNGGGAALYLYLLIWPTCIVLGIILFVKKRAYKKG